MRAAVDSSRLTTDDYLELPLGDLLDRLSANGLAPGGGSAAALTVAFSAARRDGGPVLTGLE